jgi:hypothetical protein
MEHYNFLTHNTLSYLSLFYVSLHILSTLEHLLCHYKHTTHTTVNCDKTSPMMTTVLEVFDIKAMCMSKKKKKETQRL